MLKKVDFSILTAFDFGICCHTPESVEIIDISAFSGVFCLSEIVGICGISGIISAIKWQRYSNAFLILSPTVMMLIPLSILSLILSKKL